jgi:hypothetical protein
MRCCLESGFTLLDEPTEVVKKSLFSQLVTDIAFLQWETGRVDGTRLCSQANTTLSTRTSSYAWNNLLFTLREVVSVRFRPGS